MNNAQNFFNTYQYENYAGKKTITQNAKHNAKRSNSSPNVDSAFQFVRITEAARLVGFQSKNKG